MTVRSSLLSALCLAVLVAADPSPDQIALLNKYAPQFRLTPNETFLPSSVEFFFPNVVEVLDSNGNVVPDTPFPLTDSDLNDIANSGNGTWLTFNNEHASFLNGVDPTTNPIPVYSFIVPKDNGIADLFYWTFYPWNLGKNVFIFGEIGDHFGDWEQMAVRTVNGTAVSADYTAHAAQGAGTIQWDSVLKVPGEDRPLGYVAQGSHGIWPNAGTFVYLDAIIFTLSDVTADGGPIWEGQGNIQPILFPDNYTGTDSWLNFQGMFGNQGDTTCLFFAITQECQLSNGPNGPVRPDVFDAPDPTTATTSASSSFEKVFNFMTAPLTHTLAVATPTAPQSKFTVHIGTAGLNLASSQSLSHVAVQQTCVKLGRTAFTTAKVSSTAFVPISSVEGSDAFTVGVDACSGPSVVDSFNVGLCASASTDACTWSSSRLVRAYLPGALVHSTSKAVETHDLDTFIFPS